MEKKLKSLFDFQKFDGNSELADMIAATEKRFSKNQQLSDEDLTLAAGGGDQFNEIKIGDITGFIGVFPSPEINDEPKPVGLPEGKVITGDEP